MVFRAERIQGIGYNAFLLVELAVTSASKGAER